jgi:hypothetical protein
MIKNEGIAVANRIRTSMPMLRALLNVEKEKMPTNKLSFEYDEKRIINRKGEHFNEKF